VSPRERDKVQASRRIKRRFVKEYVYENELAVPEKWTPEVVAEVISERMDKETIQHLANDLKEEMQQIDYWHDQRDVP
jgi:uncharacterized protein (DUF2267 family)